MSLGNDVGVATRAELELGAGRGARSLLGVFWGTGVGGALALDGELWRGRGAAGEIGHMVVKQGGARCPCGRRGCLEAYAGRRAMEAKALREQHKGHKTDLFEIMREKGHDALSSGVWAHALEHGDKLAQELIERAVRRAGRGIASAVNLPTSSAWCSAGGWDALRDQMVGRIGGDASAPVRRRGTAGAAARR